MTTAAVIAAVLLRWVLDPVLQDTLALVTLFGAVAFAVWQGGVLPAGLAAVAGYLACAWLFIPPRGGFDFQSATNIIGLIAYLFTCGLIVAIGQAMRRAQTSASQGREILRVTLHSIGDAVIATDNESRITYLNRVAESLTGWRACDAVGRPLDEVFRIVNEVTRHAVENPARRALREGTVVGLANHTILLSRDGGERPIDDSAAPIRDEQGRVCGCVLIFRDVSAQRLAEQERTQQLMTARLLAAIVESSDDAIISKSLDGTIRTWNAAAERLFGHSAAEAVGRHISLVIPQERIAEEDKIIASLTRGERIDHFETVRCHKDGRPIHVSLTISPIHDAHGRVVGASKIVRDIGARLQAEAERVKFDTLIESSTDFIGMCDLDGMPYFVNRAGLAMVGLDDLEAARRTPMTEFFFPEDRRRMMEEFFPRVLAEGHAETEVRFRNFKTGAPRWMSYKVVALRNSAGHAIAYATVSQDVTEHRRLTDELAAADRRKDEFLATLAHELRNPLAPIANLVEVLRRRDDDAALRAQAHATIERQVRQLVRLVDDLLDLNRINHNRLDLRPDDVELAPIIEQAVETCRPLADAAEHTLQVSQAPEKIHLRADAARLAQVFGNLLNNACRYTPRGGRISLEVRPGPASVAVSVRDNGVGIDPPELPRVFDMFLQLDRTLSGAQAGLGIGLTLVKRLVSLHGGSVEVLSEGKDRGTEFIVTLPTIAAPAMAVRPEPPTQPAAPARRILIVDDNQDAAVSLAMLLELSGSEVLTVHGGAAALAAAGKSRPDLVLLDIGMPDMDGYEVCRRIRAQPWGRKITIIALTGWGQESDRRRSLEAGFDAHLVKPVEPERLFEVLATLAGARRERRAV